MNASRWKWRVRAWYTKDVEPPKVPGGLAMEVMHGTDIGKDMEVAAFKSRADIGEVQVTRVD